MHKDTKKLPEKKYIDSNWANCFPIQKGYEDFYRYLKESKK